MSNPVKEREIIGGLFDSCESLGGFTQSPEGYNLRQKIFPQHVSAPAKPLSKSQLFSLALLSSSSYQCLSTLSPSPFEKRTDEAASDTCRYLSPPLIRGIGPAPASARHMERRRGGNDEHHTITDVHLGLDKTHLLKQGEFWLSFL